MFFTCMGVLIFGTNVDINLLGLMIQKSFGAIFILQLSDIVFQLMPQSILCDPLKFNTKSFVLATICVIMLVILHIDTRTLSLCISIQDH